MGDGAALLLPVVPAVGGLSRRALELGPQAADAFETVLRRVDELDFGTPHSSAVFYSGPGQGSLAREFAEATGRFTIEMTEGGKALMADTLFQGLSPTEQFRVWQRASEHFARSASGAVHAFLRGARSDRTFRAIEEPILRAMKKVHRYVYRF